MYNKKGDNMSIKMTKNFNQEFFNNLQKKIDLAQQENRPIDSYVRKQIELLKESHDEFMYQAKEAGHDLNSPQVGEIEVEQFSAMKALAQKIGLPIEEYDEMIKKVQIRVLGEENYKRFFENKG